MKKANIASLKNQLSRYLDYVRRGGIIRVFDRDTPIAEIVPLGHRQESADDFIATHVQSLERDGAVSRPRRRLPADFFTRELPTARRSVLTALLEERRQGR